MSNSIIPIHTYREPFEVCVNHCATFDDYRPDERIECISVCENSLSGVQE